MQQPSSPADTAQRPQHHHQSAVGPPMKRATTSLLADARAASLGHQSDWGFGACCGDRRAAQEHLGPPDARRDAVPGRGNDQLTRVRTPDENGASFSVGPRRSPLAAPSSDLSTPAGSWCAG
eukprot:CAMPEP_0175480130 /NCGR_PEP_ID=MMETSP0095-20121207/77796_1 /TAXON_ID=311494 /ORGANISM="Alexandrium monilatum, Strain CCMP3105" /LENGTH=121 /DNA_ID=CAMNT_0016781763 /DNA_START=45 /DNA_END=409 /DNA_ORIENTATION=+